jgi:hypothetical protein
VLLEEEGEVLWVHIEYYSQFFTDPDLLGLLAIFHPNFK